MVLISLVVQSERAFICADTGALVEESTRRFQPYKKYAFYFSIFILCEYYNFDSLDILSPLSVFFYLDSI